MFYSDLLTEFGKSEIKYIIVGGLSVNLHGVPRVTQDVDIILSMDRNNIMNTLAILKKMD